MVIQLLGLTSREIQDFLANYFTEYKVWALYEYHVSKINYSELLQFALESKSSVANLITLWRPKLSTDVISREDIVGAANFMKCRGLDEDAEFLDAWLGVGSTGFLDLDLTTPILEDIVDRDRIERANRTGFIDLQAIETSAVLRAEQMAAETDTRCLVNDAFLGTAKETIRTHSVSDSSQGAHPGDGIHVTPRRNRLVKYGVLVDMTESVHIPILEHDESTTRMSETKNIFGGVTEEPDFQMNDNEARRCVQRQMPMVLPQPVPGSLMASHADRGISMRACGQPDHQTNTPAQHTRRSIDPSTDSRRSNFRNTILKARAHSISSPRRAGAGSQDLRKFATLHSLQNLIDADGRLQQQNSGVFADPAGTEVSVAVSGGLSHGFQSRNSRQSLSTAPAQTQQAYTFNKSSTITTSATTTKADNSLGDSGQNEATKPRAAPVAAMSTSTQIRQELDSKWAHYLRPDGKSPVGRPGNKRKLSHSNKLDMD